MNKFKKMLIGVVATAGVACLGGAFACTGEPDFYTLTFEGVGVEYIMQGDLGEPDDDNRIFESGGKVKDGVEVRFSIVQSANAIGTPVITKNNETLTPDTDGVYSFIISADTTVTASGLNREHTLTLSKIEKVYSDGAIVDMERRIQYFDEDGELLGDEVKVEEGKPFRFKLKASIYYLPGYNVCFGSEILVPDENGVYTVAAEDISGNNTINVTGIIEEDGFTAASRVDKCGKGTEESPFLISRPIDMYYVAALVNSAFYSSFYATAHYKLLNDIDMDGEQLFVIGDNSSTTAVFCGTFDGNGHTVSNFYITDEVYDQQSYDKEYLPYVGLFGTASATEERTAVIKNLTLKDYTVTVHSGEAQSHSFVGSLVGYGVGVEISNCHLKDGEVLAIGDNNQMIYMGGLVGLLQSAYRADSHSVITHNAFVYSCSSDVAVEGMGSPRSAGGIVGNLITADTGAIAYVVNCYTTGSVSGAMHTGGIVGSLGRYSTVSNCYSTASVSANNAITLSGVLNEYKVAYAGGIVGYAESDSVISACYAANGSLSATSVHGASYQNTDNFAGGKSAAGELSVESASVVLYNNRAKSAGDTSAVFTQQLGWSENEWDFGGELPELKISGTARQFKIILKDTSDSEFDTYSKNLTNAFPMHNWYTTGAVLPEYVTDGTRRSWGYYFDKELTEKVPYGFVPTAAETVLYVGFADYSEVAGRYYLKATEYSSGVYFDLTEDGKVYLRDGGMSFSCTYSYDGDEITLYNSCFASLMYTMDEVDGGYFTVIGRKTENGFDFEGIAMLIDLENSTEENPSYVYSDINISAVSEFEGFAYGEYLDADGATYLFSKDGSGVYTSPVTGRETFTFGFEDGNELALQFASGGLRFADVAGGKVININNRAVTLKSNFNGAWRKNGNSGISFEFDGVDSVVYVNGAEKQTVNFTVESGRAVFTVGAANYEAYINQDGFLVINGEVYYLDDGFTGSWYMTNDEESVEIVFEGIGTNGYGYATLMYAGGVVATIDAQYDIYTDAEGSRLRIFVDDAQYGELLYNASDKTASGLFYSMKNSGYYTNAKFYLFDSFRGSWVSVVEGIDTVSFNGRTGDGSASVAITNGKKVQRGTYSLTDGFNGTMTVDGNTYTIKFDEAANRVSFMLTGGETNQLAKRDDWYGVVLYDGDVSYTFDGKGYLGGTVSVSDGTSLAYTVAADGSVTVGGTALVTADGGFTMGGKTLVFKTGFAGEWLISESQNTLTISEVGGNFTATAAYTGGTGNTLTLVYDAATGTLTHIQELNGERIITEYSLTGSFEMSISQRSTAGDVYLNCVNSEYADGWKGVYTAEDGSAWELDGLGKGIYGSASAFYIKDGVRTKYSYKVNALGLPYIKSDIAVVFVEKEDGEFTLGGKHYTTVIPDALYERSVYVSSGEGEPVWYLFDGTGALWLQSGSAYTQAYTYKIISASVVELTDTDGKKYTGVLASVGANTRLTIEAVED